MGHAFGLPARRYTVVAETGNAAPGSKSDIGKFFMRRNGCSTKCQLSHASPAVTGRAMRKLRVAYRSEGNEAITC